MDLIARVFSPLCGSPHVWHLGESALPFCQRCTGLYVGTLVAVVVYLAFHPRVTSRLLWLHGALLFGMIPFGYHWVDQNGVVRTVTGFLFACGIVYYLLLIPFSRSATARNNRFDIVVGTMLIALGALLFAVTLGGSSLAFVVASLGLLGLVALASLSIVSVWSLARS